MSKMLESFGTRPVVLAGLALVYFVAFPDDAQAVLGLTEAVSPGFYILVGFGIVAWTVARIWGSKKSRQG